MIFKIEKMLKKKKKKKKKTTTLTNRLKKPLSLQLFLNLQYVTLFHCFVRTKIGK
jgi:hypothetical protein